VNDTRGSLVNRRNLRAVTLAGAAVVLAVAGAACSATVQPTPIYVVVTPSPETAATEAPATPTPEVSVASFTPWPTLAPTPTPGPTGTPVPAATPVVSAGPTSPAAACSAAATNLPEFVNAAKALKFAVYCAHVGKPWGFTGMTWASAGGGKFHATWKAGSASITLDEGAFCLTPSVCSPLGGSIGTASFGGLSGQLFQTAATDFSIYVHPGTKTAYQILGHNVTQATLVSIAAGLKIIPKT
jgi:hypothetical protein